MNKKPFTTYMHNNTHTSQNAARQIRFCRPLVVFCLLLAVPCLMLPSPLSAMDFLFRPKGFLFFPGGAGNIATGGLPRYNLGGGMDIGLELDFSSIWPNPYGLGFSFGFEGGVTNNALQIKDDTMNLSSYSFGASLGLSFFPISRILLRIDGTAGLYMLSHEGYISISPDFYWRMGGEAGFRFSPTFIIAANAGWRQYEDKREGFNPAISGFTAGLTAQFTLKAEGAYSAGAEGIFVQSDPVYPAFLQLYQTSPIGNVIIRNRENAEIRDVRVSFRAAPFTSSEFLCGSVDVIPRGREIELPLFADFSPAILRFTDSGRILGELVIHYNFLGQDRTAVSTITVSTHNRNTYTEEDIAALAAFISPTSPETLEYSKYISGLARASRRTGHNQNMQFAIWLFEGLRASGLRMGETYVSNNEVQFPAETLSFGTGTSCDMALLYAAALESVGISTAFLKVGTDYIIAFNLAIGPAAAETLFNGTDRVLNINNEIWVPVALSAFNNGFIASWVRAAVTLNQAFQRNDTVDFVMAKDAWAVYPPAPLPELGSHLVRSNSDAVITEANRSIEQYITQEIMPLIWGVEAQIRTNPSAALYNRLGILFARSGRINDAITHYERAANMGLVAAMTNLGSLALTERNYDLAERWFRQALTRDSNNSAALRGLERVEGRR